MANVKAEILGATNHQLHIDFTNVHACKGSWCFGPTVSNRSKGRGPEFIGVSFYKGLAIGYNQRMQNHTTVAAALALLRVNLPVDTMFGSVTKMSSPSGEWGDVAGTSKSLGKLMPGFDPKGKFCVYFHAFLANGNTSYSTTDVQEASVSSWVAGVEQGC